MGRVVHSSGDEASARWVCDLLASHGIPFRVNGSSLTALRGALPIAEASVTVEVLRDDDVERARALLAEMEAAAAERDPWSCLGCGEDNPGNFDVCWKCGKGSSWPTTAGSASSPYRGERAVVPASLPDPASASSAISPGDLGWALLVGCLPVALTGAGIHALGALSELGPVSRTSAINCIMGAELAACLALLRRRGVHVGELWGGQQRSVTDLVAAALLGGIVFLGRRSVYRLALQMGASAFGAGPGARSDLSAAGTLEWAFLIIGIGFAAATGALVLYGVVLPAIRAWAGSRTVAVIVTALVATLMWSSNHGLAMSAAVLVVQLVLCGASLMTGRVWPIAVAAASDHLAMWLDIAARS